jgi:hypothetical protein
MFETAAGSARVRPEVKILLYIWFALLIPWFLFAMLCGMAFDAGPTWFVYMFVWSTWTYPLALGLAFAFRRKAPLLSLLPALNLIAFLVSGSQP